MFHGSRSGRLVSHGDGPRAVAPSGSEKQDGGDGCGHAGAPPQLGLGQQLPAAVQRHGPSLERAPTGRRRHEVGGKRELGGRGAEQAVALAENPFPASGPSGLEPQRLAGPQTGGVRLLLQ
ncbi:hypothetical protein LDENG_00236140 [Lucifuga dentata]|nr:hypothetical protein LDENG_00236140 [Lucifuga dentata]